MSPKLGAKASRGRGGSRGRSSRGGSPKDSAAANGDASAALASDNDEDHSAREAGDGHADAGGRAERKPKRAASAVAGNATGRKKGKLGVLTCGRCGKTQGPSIPWPSAPDQLGRTVPVGTACQRCWGPFQKCWSRLGFEWASFCGQCHSEPDFNQKVEATCQVMEGSLEPSWDPSRVTIGDEVGIETSLHFQLIKEKQLEDTGLPRGLGIKQLGFKPSSVPSPHGGGMASGLITQHPTEPLIQVKVFSRTLVSHATTKMDKEDELLDDQGTHTKKQELADFMKRLPTCLRGHIAPPTLEQVKNKAKGILAGRGAQAAGDNGESEEDTKPEDAEEGEEEDKERDDEVATSADEGHGEFAGGHFQPAGASRTSGSLARAPSASTLGTRRGGDEKDEFQKQPDPVKSLAQRRSPKTLASPRAVSHQQRPRAQASAEASPSVGGRGSVAPSRCRAKSSKGVGDDDAASAASGATFASAALRSSLPSPQGGVDDDLARYRDLTERCSADKILNGKMIGGDVYAAKRFRDKTKSHGLAAKAGQLVEVAELASKLTPAHLDSLSAEDRTSLLRKLHGKKRRFEYPAPWCMKVVKAPQHVIPHLGSARQFECLEP